MITTERITEIVSGYFEGSNFFIVEISVTPSNKVSVFIERHEGMVTIEDCVLLSKHIETFFNRDEEDFELEVSSAGMELPFRAYGQYVKHRGAEITVLRKDGIRLNGILGDVNEKEIVVETEKKEKVEGFSKKQLVKHKTIVEFDSIKETKRVFKF